MKKLLIISLLILTYNTTFAQSNLPVLETNTKELDVKDGDFLMTKYWTIDAEIEIDVYEADKTSQIKMVTFYSDVDSISFELKPKEQHDFLVIYKNEDTCLTRIKSGIVTIDKSKIKLTQDTIPFWLTSSNNVIIQTILNQSDTLNLMFHTAQSTISLTEEAVKKITKKSFDESTTAISWGGEHTSRYSRGNFLKIKDFEWKNVTIWEDKNTGPSADGKFGPNLFDNKIIELNFDKNILVIHSYLPEINQNYEQEDLVFKSGMMFIETAYKIEENVYTNQVLIHSGYGGTLLLDDKFVQDHKIGEQLETISESQLTDSYGNILKTKKAILPYFAIGANSFTNMPVNFFEGTIGRQRMSVIGGDVLKRFNVFFDLQNAQIYYTPNKLSTVPFGKI